MLFPVEDALEGAAFFLLIGAIFGATAAVLAGFLFVAIPSWGALVRIRANYLPKGVALDEAGKVGPAVYSVPDMKRRVEQLEGRSSLWRGTSLMLYFIAVLALAYFVVLTAIMIPFKIVSGADHGTLAFFSAMVLIVVTVPLSAPMEVLLRRTIVHPHGLDWRHPRACLRELMTDDELNNPWRLYMIPDVLPTMGLMALYGLILAASVFPLPSLFLDSNVLFFPTAAFAAILIILSCLLTPLDCALVRLMVQRPLPAAEPPTAESPEPVIELRPHAESTPAYTGIADCLRKMVAEEGVESIWRGSFVHAHVLQ